MSCVLRAHAEQALTAARSAFGSHVAERLLDVLGRYAAGEGASEATEEAQQARSSGRGYTRSGSRHLALKSGRFYPYC
jgi:hypothetical protein